MGSCVLWDTNIVTPTVSYAAVALWKPDSRSAEKTEAHYLIHSLFFSP